MLVGLAIGLVVGIAAFFSWKATHAKAIREDAIRRSQSVITGKVSEQLLPYLPGFGYNPKDVRFLGSPIDFVVFDGMAAGKVERIVFLEAKTGTSQLTPRERQIKEIVVARRIEWEEWHVGV